MKNAYILNAEFKRSLPLVNEPLTESIVFVGGRGRWSKGALLRPKRECAALELQFYTSGVAKWLVGDQKT